MEPNRRDQPSGQPPTWPLLLAAVLLLFPPLNRLWPLVLIGAAAVVFSERVSVRRAMPWLIVGVLAGLSSLAWNVGWQVLHALRVPAIRELRLPGVASSAPLRALTGAPDQALDLAGVERVRVSTFNGNITARSGASEARMRGQRSGGTTIEITREGSTLVVQARQPFLRPGGGASLDLGLPEGLDLELQTANGRIDASGPARSINARNANGSIEVRDARLADLDLQTANATVTVSGPGGQVRVRNTNGAVRISGGRQAVIDLETSNGSIVLDDLNLRAGSSNQAKSSNGAITVTGLDAPGGVSVRASTSNARCDANLPGYDVNASEHTLTALLPGDDPARLELRTSNAPVVLRH